jgi:hypothetical protein
VCLYWVLGVLGVGCVGVGVGVWVWVCVLGVCWVCVGCVCWVCVGCVGLDVGVGVSISMSEV